MVCRIAKKDTWCGAGSKFMKLRVVYVWEAEAPEGAQVGIGRLFLV